MKSIDLIGSMFPYSDGDVLNGSEKNYYFR